MQNEPIDLYAIAIKQAADAVRADAWACTLANCRELREATRNVQILTELMMELAA